MNTVFKKGFLVFRENAEIFLQFCVTISRPIFFTVLVTSLRDDESLRYFIYAIGFIGFFAIFDLVIQSYIRSRHLVSSGNINLKGIFTIAAILLILFSFYGPIDEPLLTLLITIYFLNSLIFFYEYDLSKKKCIFITYSSELLIASLSVLLIFIGIHYEFLVFIAFASFPIGRILGLIIYHFVSFFSDDSFNTKVDLPSPSKKIRSVDYMTYSIGQAIFGAIAGSLPVIFFNVIDNYNLYTVALVYMRWFHVFGALASTIINVLGPRIFYRTMNINIFVKNAHWLAKNEARIKGIILINFILLLGFIIYFNEINIIVMIASVFILAVMNYFSSLLNSFARPDLSLVCHVIVLGLSFHICSIIFNTPLIGLLSLAGSFLMFIFIYRIMINEFRNLSV